MKWEDIDWEKQQLNVVRTVWHRDIIDTKTEHRAAPVHLLPNVITELKRHHKESPGTKWVFEGPRVFPLDLATLASKRIKEALQGCVSPKCLRSEESATYKTRSRGGML